MAKRQKRQDWMWLEKDLRWLAGYLPQIGFREAGTFVQLASLSVGDSIASDGSQAPARVRPQDRASSKVKQQHKKR